MLALDRCLRVVLTVAFVVSIFTPGIFGQTNSSNQASGNANATKDTGTNALTAGAGQGKKSPSKAAGNSSRTARNANGTPAENPSNTGNANQPVSKWLSVVGDFRAIKSDGAASQCARPATTGTCNMDACARLLAQDGTTEVGTVSCLSFSSDDEVSLTYTPKTASAAVPAFLAIGKKDPPDHVYSMPASKLPQAAQELTLREQVISGDFCEKDENCDCTTPFLKPSTTGSAAQCQAHPEVINAAPNWSGRVKAAVRTSDSESHAATLKSFGPDSARVSFSAPNSFKPAWLDVYTDNYSRAYVYNTAQALQVNNLNYVDENLSWVCDESQGKPDCLNTLPQHLQLKPISVGAEVAYVAMTDKLLVARVKAPMGLEPAAIIVTNISFTPRRNIMVRRTVKPGQNARVLRVDMTIMDQVTAQRNYGDRIAKRYIAVTLDVKNPTNKKIQFTKSALYFDVDYVEAKERPKDLSDWFWVPLKYGVTLGTYDANVYKPPFVAGREDRKTPRVARFGLEQNVRHAPVNYLSALGSFDYTTTKTDDKLKALELVGSVLSNIATGGVVADASGAFKAGTSIFSGTFLPGLRSLVLNTSFINRLRSNLVAQTLQDTIQVSANGSTSTIVLLPRMGILAFTDAEVPVMVDRVIDVHLDEEVVTPITETPAKKGQCTAGNTKEQTREALGEPTGVTTEADNTSTFTWSKGPVVSASFDVKGVLQSCKTRTASEQLNLATALTDANQTLSDLGLTSTKLELADGSVILTDIPGVNTVYRFDSKGARLPDYTLLFDEIKTQKGKTKDEFEQYLQTKAQAISPERSTKIKEGAPKTGKVSETVRYPSPDVKDGVIVVKFKASDKEKDKTKLDGNSTVENINFEGAKPKSVN